MSLTAQAVVITSNDFDSFAAAVESAPAGETFTFDLGANSTILFERGIEVPSSLTFIGEGQVTFDGQGTSGLFFVPIGKAATFSGLTFQHSGSSAIFNSGQLSVSDSLFFQNSARNAGGAIYSGGIAVITNSTFLQNSASNAGGAIHSNGTLTLSRSLFQSNHANNAGGGMIATAGPFSFVIENSTFTANQADNASGAIGVLGPGIVHLRNLTVSGNQAQSVGGGIDTTQTATVFIDSSLVANNSAFGPDLYTSFGDTVTVRNSLIGNSFGNNLQDGVNGNVVGNGSSVRGFPINQLLGPLGNHGGSLATMPLLDFGGNTNPAINSGSNLGGLPYDQRGAPFARTSGGGVDIGAFERQFPVPEPSPFVLAIVGFMGWLSCLRHRKGR